MPTKTETFTTVTTTELIGLQSEVRAAARGTSW